jgi:hypothetical protein
VAPAAAHAARLRSGAASVVITKVGTTASVTTGASSGNDRPVVTTAVGGIGARPWRARRAAVSSSGWTPRNSSTIAVVAPTSRTSARSLPSRSTRWSGSLDSSLARPCSETAPSALATKLTQSHRLAG